MTWRIEVPVTATGRGGRQHAAIIGNDSSGGRVGQRWHVVAGADVADLNVDTGEVSMRLTVPREVLMLALEVLDAVERATPTAEQASS